MSAPFGPSTVSLGLHPQTGGSASAQIDGLITLAVAAENAGFDGVTLSEHHAGFPGYLPQPLLASAWILDATRSVWCGPAPMLLGLRNPLLVVEELAWLAAHKPGRLGAAFAPGYTVADYDAVGVSHADRTASFAAKLSSLAAAWQGDGPLGADVAVAEAAASGAVLLSAANSTAAVRRAAALRLGLIYPGGEDPRRLGGFSRTYRESGGDGPIVWIARVGFAAADVPSANHYQSAAVAGMRQAAGFAHPPAVGDADAVTGALRDATDLIGADGINLRLVDPDRPIGALLEDLSRLGEEVIPTLRASWSTRSPKD